DRSTREKFVGGFAYATRFMRKRERSKDTVRRLARRASHPDPDWSSSTRFQKWIVSGPAPEPVAWFYMKARTQGPPPFQTQGLLPLRGLSIQRSYIGEGP